MQQEKMELDLEIPSALVQTDGHLRRSNSVVISDLYWILLFVKRHIFHFCEAKQLKALFPISVLVWLVLSLMQSCDLVLNVPVSIINKQVRYSGSF
uniref:Uncharacterized protein n=1 Tax=Periophthalmus magnuspinnatus TaxID=409849 RepID=A0A3B4AH63_9GOBI